MKKILLIGVMLLSITLFGIWAEAVENIKYEKYDTGEIFAQLPLDKWNNYHGIVVHYWKDGRIFTMQHYWHGMSEKYPMYLDIVSPAIWQVSVRQFHNNFGQTSKK